MRLTLRTLLAYLDDILDPADKEELAQKIQTSEFAEDLVHRTRDTMRRLRLSAPQPIGVGMGLDPNSVAEYLDNVLPPEQVGDYERICLESDVHLAEAAACHHVLTMVLGEPANVEPRARQRMYNIPAEARERKRMRVEPAHARAAASVAPIAPVTAVAAMPAAPTTRTAVEIPEYLRAKPWWQSRGVLAALAAVLLIGVAWFAYSGFVGWSSTPTDVAQNDDANIAPPFMADEADEQQAEQPADEVEVDPAVPPVVADAAPASEAPADTTSATEPAVTEPAASTPAEAGSTVGERYADTSASPPPLAAPPLTTPPQPVAPELSASPPTVEEPAIDPAATPAPPDGAPANETVTTNVVPPTDAAAPPIETVTVPPQDASAEAPTEPAAPTDDTTRVAAATPAVPPGDVADVAVEGDAEIEVPGPPELGTYLSGKTVLLRYDERNGAWFRVQPRSAVVVGERLLALPEFRPTIALASGVNLNLAGGTMVAMSTGDSTVGPGTQIGSREIPVVEVLYGRIILINTSPEESLVGLKAGGHAGEVHLDRNATLAVEVERQYVPGNDPRKTAAPVVVRMFAPEGGVVWRDATGEVTVEKASRWTLAEGAPAQVADDPAPPDWIDQEPTDHPSEQRFGAPVIESTIVSDKPADIQLLELYKGSGRKEVKSLATRSSIHVGLFAPFVEALRDSQQKWPTWRTHVETLRASMASSPEAAERVAQELTEQRGRTASADLYEMLCGYNAEQIGSTPDEVKVGAVARLIDSLEEDNLDYRVLAVYNLWEITGKQLMPNPAASATVRKQNVRRWKERLDSGELAAVKKEG